MSNIASLWRYYTAAFHARDPLEHAIVCATVWPMRNTAGQRKGGGIAGHNGRYVLVSRPGLWYGMGELALALLPSHEK